MSFLVASFGLLLKPSTTHDEIVPSARNQFKIKGGTTRFSGSCLVRMVRVHHFLKGSPRPASRFLVPEPLELMPQQMSANRSQIVFL